MKRALCAIIIICAVAPIIVGCEAFRKKFVRKPKKEEEVKVVVYTHEYESQYTVDQLYKRYYMYEMGIQ